MRAFIKRFKFAIFTDLFIQKPITILQTIILTVFIAYILYEQYIDHFARW